MNVRVGRRQHIESTRCLSIKGLKKFRNILRFFLSSLDSAGDVYEATFLATNTQKKKNFSVSFSRRRLRKAKGNFFDLC